MSEKCQQLSSIWKNGVKMTLYIESSRTDAEKCLAEALRQKKILFKHNQTIAGYEVDFWFPDCGLVIEVDGFTHLSTNQRMLDQKKDQILLAKGMVVIRMSNQQIREHLGECLHEIETTIKKIKAFRSEGNINQQWKMKLGNYHVAEKKPVKVAKTIEEYFLSMDEKPK
jgi:very-short-patch-repair endonuclease